MSPFQRRAFLQSLSYLALGCFDYLMLQSPHSRVIHRFSGSVSPILSVHILVQSALHNDAIAYGFMEE